jgi:hypothetical protein
MTSNVPATPRGDATPQERHAGPGYLGRSWADCVVVDGEQGVDQRCPWSDLRVGSVGPVDSCPAPSMTSTTGASLRRGHRMILTGRPECRIRHALAAAWRVRCPLSTYPVLAWVTS